MPHFNRRTALKLGLVASAGVALPGATALAGRSDWLSAFSRTNPVSRPWIRWWWPGGAVQDAELAREIDLLKAAGFGGGEIQAFNPAIPGLTPDERAHLNDYADPAFFDHVKLCAERALKAGVQIDYTFGSAWPSGGGFAVTPELALVELTPAITSITAPVSGPVKLNLPAQTKKFGAMGGLDARNRDPRAAGWKDRLEKRWRLIAVVAVHGTAAVAEGKTFRDSNVVTPGRIAPGAGIVVTGHLQPDGTLDWTPPAPGPWQIVAFKQFTVDSSVMAGVGEGPQLVLDHFNKAAFAAHAARVGDPLDGLGAARAAIRATFIDSLELMTDLHWSDDFLDQFRARRGYDLTPYLPYILQPGWMNPWNPRVSPPYYVSDDTGDRVRADYRATVSDLLIENFWEPFVAWNHAHGFKARLQAHGGPSNLIRTYGLADIPETEDLGTGAATHYLRLARCAANIQGRPIVSCESLCWIGKPYEITPAQWLARANLLFASGVNELIMHGFPYALHKDKWPGWFPFEPSPFLSGFSSLINESNPLWAAIPSLNDYITRAQGLLQSGKTQVPVAVLMTQVGYGSNAGEDTVEAWLQGLLDAGYDYDRIDPDGLKASRPSGKALHTPGGTAYAAIVVPGLDGIDPDLLDCLSDAMAQGVTVLFIDRYPGRSNSLRDAAADDARILQTVAALKAAGASAVPAAQAGATLAGAGIRANVVFHGKPCLFIEKRHGGETLYLFHNASDAAMSLDCEVAAAGYPSRLFPHTGERTALDARRNGASARFTVDIEPGAAAFILFAPGKPPLSKPAAVLDTRPGPDAWNLSLQGHGHRGRPVALDRVQFHLTDLSGIEDFADFSGEAVYSALFAADGAWHRPGARVWLDLGAVHDVARVFVNGTDLGMLISPPFQVEISKALKPGVNALVIRVFNGPNNAMMDPKLPGLKALTRKPSGLTGPVRFILKA